MKYIIFVTVLLAICNNVASRSTVADLLQIGNDAVFRYESEIMLSYMGAQSFEKYNCIFFVRKMSMPNKFIVRISNIIFHGNNPYGQPPTAEDLKAMEFPVVASVNDKFELNFAMASPADTKKSLSEKYKILDLLFVDLSETVASLPAMLVGDYSVIHSDEKLSDMPFGECTVTKKFSRKYGRFTIKMKGKRYMCTGQIDDDILHKLKTQNIDANSEFKHAYLFDVNTLNYNGAEMKVEAKDIADPRHKYKTDAELYFSAYRPSDEAIDESLLSVKYTADQLDSF